MIRRHFVATAVTSTILATAAFGAQATSHSFSGPWQDNDMNGPTWNNPHENGPWADLEENTFSQSHGNTHHGPDYGHKFDYSHDFDKGDPPKWSWGDYSHKPPKHDYRPPKDDYCAPVPEPETYALMTAGLGVLGFIGRRRRTVLPRDVAI